MKKRFVRHNFNMVEIMLAVIVIALGIAGTFVLFPVGVNANKDATAENCLADIAQYTDAVVRALLLQGSNSPRQGFREGFVTNHLSAQDPVPAAAANPADLNDETTWTASILSSNGPRILRQHSSARGVFLYRQLSGNASDPVVDFAAVVRVYLDGNSYNSNVFDNEYFFRDRTTPQQYSTMRSNVDIFRFLLPLVMEVSWPATSPYDEREKRYFRFEVFNTLYDITQDN